MRVLWNQLIGFLFLVFSVPIIGWAFRHGGDPNRGPAMAVTAVAFGLLLAYFGVTSFLKARKISRAR